MSAELPLVERVAEIAAEVLGIPRLEADADLFAVNGFSSLTVVDLVDQLERRLRLEIDAAAIVPETFATPATLAALVAHSRGARSGGVR